MLYGNYNGVLFALKNSMFTIETVIYQRFCVLRYGILPAVLQPGGDEEDEGDEGDVSNKVKESLLRILSRL